MKNGDKTRTSTLKLLASELHNSRINKGADLSSEEELIIVKKEAKKRRDAIQTFTKLNKKEAAKQEESELQVLQDFLPEELSDSEIEEFVEEAIGESSASSMADMGKVMALSMQKAAGRADGARVSKIVKKKLQ